MSQDEWDALQPGMIVVERRSKTPRLVLSVKRRPWKIRRRRGSPSRRERECVVIELFKLRSGGYPCPTTDLYPSDWRARLDVAHGKRGIVRAEFFYCECHGWSHVSGERRCWVDPAFAAVNRNWRTGCKLRADNYPAPQPDWSTMPWVRA
jgi:hypothetical protein